MTTRKPGSQAFEDDERAATAVHEAGHAVACYVLGIPFTYVTIKPDPKAGSLGHVRSMTFTALCEKMFGPDEEAMPQEWDQEWEKKAAELQEEKRRGNIAPCVFKGELPSITEAEREAIRNKVRDDHQKKRIPIIPLARDYIVTDFAGPVAQEAFGYGSFGDEGDVKIIAKTIVDELHYHVSGDTEEEERRTKERELEYNRGRQGADELVQRYRLSIMEVAEQLLLHETLSKEKVEEIVQKNR